MAKRLTFLHTAPVLVDTFNGLLKELAPDIPAQHIIDEGLLREARERGEITPELTGRVCDIILDSLRRDASVVLCTCSTIGACAEAANRLTDKVVMRVDRPMAEGVVAAGSRIVVAATLGSTIGPTCKLIHQVADEAGKEVQIIEWLCETAWARLERGDRKGYLEEIAGRLREAQGDVIVLAQATMAPAAELCPDLRIPVLSSPRPGLEAAIKAYRSCA